MDKFRRFIIWLAIISFSSYPLLALLAEGIDALTGNNSATSSSGLMTHDPISDVGFYVFMIGMPAAVALTFIYIALRSWNDLLNRSKLKVVGWLLIGTIATSISFTVFTIILILMGALIHGGFS
jgi:hypothetical protein